MTEIDRIEALLAKATPGPWEEEYDPCLPGDHATAVCLPGYAGQMGTFLAYCQHNWHDVVAGERRISWKEAETNAALIVALHNAAPALIAAARENERLRKGLSTAVSCLEQCTNGEATQQDMEAWAEDARAALEGDKP